MLRLAAISLILLSILVSCQPAPQPEQRYPMRGTVVRLDQKARVATIEHEKIEGWMEAMTMDFPVKDEAGWKHLSPGRRITATVFVRGMEFHIGGIQPAP